jgi:hypothetical protein
MSVLSIGRAWEETSAFLRREMRLVMPVALALFAIPATLAGWISPSAQGQPGGGPGWLITLIVLIAAMMGQLTIAGLAVGWPESLGSAIARSFARVWGMLAAAMIAFLPLAVVAVLVLAVILGSAGLTDPARLTPEAMMRAPGITVFMIGLLLVFLFLGARLFPMSAIAFCETSSPFALLGRAWRMTSGHFGRLVAVLLLFLIAAAVLGSAVTAVIGSAVTLASGEITPFSLSALLVALFEGVVSAAVSAISAAMVGRIYAQLSGSERLSVPDVERAE